MIDSNQFEYDESGNLPREDVIQNFKDHGKCPFNCWLCHFNKHGVRSNIHQAPFREEACSIIDFSDRENPKAIEANCPECKGTGVEPDVGQEHPIGNCTFCGEV